jgi:hypothetical protein
MNTTEYPPRHIQGFRPLVPGEQWHRTDFTPNMLPEGWRPLLLGEYIVQGDAFYWQMYCEFVQEDFMPAQTWHSLHRTRRPLPPPPPTFEHDGKVWNSHVPGDPCPVDDSKGIEGLMANGIIDTRLGNGSTASRLAKWWWWFDCGKTSLIGYRIPDAEPQDDTAKLRERIAELEQKLSDELHHTVTLNGRIAELEFLLEDERKKYLGRSQHIEDLEHDLRTALTPRPIAEAGEVKEGFRRWYLEIGDSKVYSFGNIPCESDTHFIDIRLPEPDPRAEYERALAECGGDPVALYAKMKGGAA